MDIPKQNAHWADNLLVRLATDGWLDIDVTALSMRDLSEVGRYFRVSDWRNPFRMIRRFNKLMQLAGVSIERELAFYDSLDFAALAQRANGPRTTQKFHFIIDVLQKTLKSGDCRPRKVYQPPPNTTGLPVVEGGTKNLSTVRERNIQLRLIPPQR